MNQLSLETSPYLLQHKDNPVHWRIWSPQALAEAQAADKPILLSVGYAACHWCHVMAAESFEDHETARLMNDLFIPIKVDREERPDIDAIYQNALNLMRQNGGWPLTMFLTPAAEPFWGGTYFPPTAKFGRPAFRDVLQRVAEIYRKREHALNHNTALLRQGLADLSRAEQDDVLTADTLDEACARIASLIDPVDGGLGRAPKFPQSPALALLWRGYRRTGRQDWRQGVLLSLDHMSQGGIYDHLGGGYARYSTDDRWLAPHFEKMLYDNAQLIELLCWAYQETKNPLYAARIGETIAWMLREMRVENAAFAAALDADSEHEEGKFYVWTAAEIEALLGPQAALFKNHYDVHWIGNWEGKTILNRSGKPALMDAQTESRLQACRQKLLSARETRIRPGRDHKVLADWNGLAIAALCQAAGLFGNQDWLDAAKQAFAFIAGNMISPEGHLQHAWCAGKTHPGLLEDTAAMARAALALHQATGEHTYLAWAEGHLDQLEQRFADHEQGGYFMTPANAQGLPTRLRNAHDQATPSGNGLLVEIFATLHMLTSNPLHQQRAERQIGAFAGDVRRNPLALATFLSGLDFYLNAVHIVILAGAGLDDLRAVINSVSLPSRVLTVIAEGAPPPAGKSRIGDKATAFVCKQSTCSLPITEPALLQTALKKAEPSFSF